MADATICPACGKATDLCENDSILTPGSMLSQRYVVGRLLGQGGFGATYLGFDQRLSSKVAIKEYLPFGCAARANDRVSIRVNPTMRETYQFGLSRFLDEAKMLARFRGSKNIVSVFDFFPENGSAYIVMEFIQGNTLKQKMGSHPTGKIPAETMLPILEGVLSALDEVHAVSILHRDISPDNIFLCDASHAKLLDFGAAREAVSNHTQKLSVIIKPGYAPFEQYTEEGNHGPWSDLYAVGATFYHSLTGIRPPDALKRTTRDELISPRDLGVILPKPLEAALLRALALRAEDRFQSAADFLGALKSSSPLARKVEAPLVAAPLLKAAPLPARTDAVVPARSTGQTSQATDGSRSAGQSVSTITFAKMFQEHQRYLKGQPKGRRLDLSFRCLTGLPLARLNLSSAELRGTSLISCDLSGTNLSRANLFCADLSGSKLEGCNLANADLRGAKFDGADLTDAILDGADCRDGILMVQEAGGGLTDVHNSHSAHAASFCGANLQRASFQAADLAGAAFRAASIVDTHFEKANLRSADFAEAKLVNPAFAGANLTDADFVAADITQCDTSRPEFAKARIVRHLDEIDEVLREQILDHQRWVVSLSKEGKRLVMRDCDLSGLQMKGVDWSAAEFYTVVFHDVVLRHAKLSMTAFRDCKLDNADFRKTDARGAVFSRSSMIGANLSEADFSPVASVRESAKHWNSSFKQANLTGANLSGCRMAEGEFTGTNLTDANLTGSVLKDADFTGAILTGADFTGADTTGANFTDTDTSGAKGLSH